MELFGNLENLGAIQKALMEQQLYLDCQHHPIPWHIEFWATFRKECAARQNITSYDIVVMLALGKRGRIDDFWHYRDLYDCTELYLLNPFRCAVLSDDNDYSLSKKESLGYHVVKCVPQTDETITDVATNYSDFKHEIMDIFKRYLENSLLRKKPDEFANALEQCVRAHSVK